MASPHGNPEETRPEAGVETVEVPPSGRAVHKLPEHIGPYRILECIGEGGMGVVYKAEQRQPVRRIVALKVIKLGMDTKEVVARFEAERQALAMLSHPNVAKVFEAGMTETGRPYFAMEHVPGVPITQYCDDNKLTTRQRLELFIPICNAIQHAHQKGIIHRDLKPSNILVQMFDGGPVPKVIDFGISKATNSALTQKTLFTQTGAMVGTPEYMSPEQAMTSGLDVDTRTDIYSLGVILYELLTGTLPFDPEGLRKAGPEQMARIIKDTEPAKPSLRLTGVGRTQKPDSDGHQVAKRHDTDLRTLQRELKGDLDWIVLKAMEKDRTRRYETANGLAVDLRRHLENEPVSARPPSASYRMSKLLRKHRLAFGAAAGIAGALVVGLVGTTTAMLQAHRERDHARLAQDRETRQREAAEHARAEADSANRFMRDLFTSFVGNGGQSRRLLDGAVRRLDSGWLADQPDTQAACRMIVGYSYLNHEAVADGARQFDIAIKSVRTPTGEIRSHHIAGMCLEGYAIVDLIHHDMGSAERHFTEAAAELRRDSDVGGQLVHVLDELASLRDGLNDARGAKAARFELVAVQINGYTHEIADRPNDASLLYQRAVYRVRHGDFAPALDDLNRAVALDPSDHWRWYLAGCVRKYLGDEEGYRQACRQMLERFAAADAPEIGDRTAKACLLSPVPAADLEQITGFIDRAVASKGSLVPWFQMCKGLAEYRAGRYASARDWLTKSISLDNQWGGATVGLLLAMADYQLGNATTARASYRAVLDRVDSKLPKPGVDDLGSSPENFLVFQILRREAAKLMEGSQAYNAATTQNEGAVR